ncbi:MAG: hypothetical protein A3G64_02170 [Candidatus Liptonbacteria bacterium RIFCSPLOWO2_12_FULL_60_15]|uniref:Uncharacterized protein n=1 Tax=Candidatus Liptonbacteria bacterium RIFCSPLOWO2_12_FULL_60_15 TaxID=1798653 RepID=A0A1G2CML7_9BACT|nr:MAG: hypothetical protein A3G64_02170 [Candidatus Liptonbacteria bacterium RIFCSPLOWO2_12_FULL_60_15]
MHRRTRCGGYLMLVMLVMSVTTLLYLRQHPASEAHQVTVPDVERWTEDCGEFQPIEFFLLKFCANPDGKGEIGVRGFYLTKGREVYIGKAWGITKDPAGGIMPVNLKRIRVLLVLKDGREFQGAAGAKPEMTAVFDKRGDQIGIKLRLRGADGSYAERVMMADPEER